MKKIVAGVLSALMLFSAACAESVALDATVVSTQTLAVFAPSEGTVTALFAQTGEHVDAGTQLAALSTTYVCAEQAGTVTLYGAEGDSLAAVITRYGAAASIEPDVKYTVSASTRYAYDSIETQLVHNGENVFVRSTSDSSHSGLGMIYGVSGTDYAVELTDGGFDVGESVAVYRGTMYAASKKLGKGTIARVEPIAYTGSETGTISKICVQNGQHVERGEVLYELLSVTPSSLAGYDADMSAAESGVVSEFSVAVGDAVTQGSVIAKVYPDSAIRLEVEVPETDLANIQIGQQVQVEFGNGQRTEGEVERISGVAMESTEDDDTAVYAAYVTFASSESVRYGMSATVTTVEGETVSSADTQTDNK